MSRGPKVNLCYVHSGPVPAMAANAVHVAKMNSALVGAGARVALICRGAPHTTPGASEEIARAYDLQHGFPVLRLPVNRWTGGRWVFSAASTAVARLLNADVFYTRDPRAALRAAASGLATVYEAHADVSWFGESQRHDFQTLARLPRFVQLVTISQALADDFAERFPALRERIFVAHDGADPAKPVEAVALRRNGRLSIGYLGHLYPGKGMELIAPLAALCPWADFHVVGGSSEDVDDWRARTEKLSNLTFHGFVAHREIGAYLAAFDVVLAPYQRSVTIAGGNAADVARWMSPLKMFEYMAAGRAIVASRLPVLEEVLEDDRTALLCEPDDPAQWAAALVRLRDDAALRARLGKTAREVFLGRHTWARRAELILADLMPRLPAQTR